MVNKLILGSEVYFSYRKISFIASCYRALVPIDCFFDLHNGIVKISSSSMRIMYHLFVSMVLSILCFSFSENPVDLLKVLKRFTFLSVENAFFSVDSFFLLR